MMTELEVHSDLAIPPGEYLEEVLDDLGMTKDELAKRMDRPATKLSGIFSGKKAITPDTALQLEKVVGIPAHVWTGLEAEYRLTLERQAELMEEERLTDEASLVRAYCYNELSKLGHVKVTRNRLERVRELHSYLGVTSLQNVGGVRRYAVAYRRSNSNKHTPSPEALISWLRIGEKTGQETDCPVFNHDSLKASLSTIRSLTQEAPEEFEPKLRGILANAGVVLVLCPHLPKTYAHGATFWLGKDKAVLMMTIRGKWADIFWFSLFHEIGHILLHGTNKTFIEFDGGDTENEKQEDEADKFARDTLIPQDKYKAFVKESAGSVYDSATLRFARSIGVHAGIVVGRLQHDGYLKPQWQNELRVRLQWAD